MHRKIIAWMVCFGFLALGAVDAAAQTTEFTYQGELTDGGQPENGAFDFEFKLFTAESGGTQMGSTVSHDDVPVADGRFTVSIDFGASSDNFNGDSRWLEIAVRPGASSDPGDFVTLIPRQPITATPYSLHTRGIVVNDDGDVGIGTKTPQFDLHVNRGGSALTNPTATIGARSLKWVIGDTVDGWVYLKNTVEESSLIRESGTPLYIGTDSTIGGALISQITVTGSGNVGIGTTSPTAKLEVVGPVQISGALAVGGSAGVTGTLGVGTQSPSAKMQVIGGTDSDPSGGGYLLLGNTSGSNLSLDNNEIMALNNGAVTTLHLNNNGGTVAIGSGASGNTRLGLGTSSPTERLDLGGGNIAMGYTIVEAESPMDWYTVTVTCPAGMRVIGGGCQELDGDEWILASRPEGNNGWFCKFDSAPEDYPLRGYAICANIR